jgi:hypothetical protein
VLLEVWQGLKNTLTLLFASPSQLQVKSWNVIEVFCSHPAEVTSSEAVKSSTGYKEESEVSAKSERLP